MSVKYYIGITLFILCAVLGGCEKEQNLKDNLQILSEPPKNNDSFIENLGIYIDATPSMVGFLGMDTENYIELVPETKYALCLDEIDKIVANDFIESQVIYYRTDTALWETKENVLKKGRNKEYYMKKNDEEENYIIVDMNDEKSDEPSYDNLCLKSALLHCQEDDFSILITDFYENTADASAVIKALKQNMGSNISEKIIGILGIKSEFSGIVYDLNPNGRKEEYGIFEGEITAEDICYRQFYIIVIGQAEKVKDFCKKLQDNMNLDDDFIKSIIFYEENFNGLDFTSFKQCYPQVNNRLWKLWPNGSVEINNNAELIVPIHEYYNKDGSMKDVTASYDVKEASLKNELEKGIERVVEGLPGVDEPELIEVPVYMEEQTISLWNQENQIFEETDNKVDIFALKGVYYSLEKELLYVSFQLGKIKETESPLKISGEIYLERHDNLDMDWVEDWNMENGNEDLGKTRNLKIYIDALKDSMPQRNNLLLNFVIYIK